MCTPSQTCQNQGKTHISHLYYYSHIPRMNRQFKCEFGGTKKTNVPGKRSVFTCPTPKYRICIDIVTAITGNFVKTYYYTITILLNTYGLHNSWWTIT